MSAFIIAVKILSKQFKLKLIKKIFMYETLLEANLNFVNIRYYHSNCFIDISKFIKKIKLRNKS